MPVRFDDGGEHLHGGLDVIQRALMSARVALMLAMFELVGIAGGAQATAAADTSAGNVAVATASSGTSTWKEGVDYERVTPPQPVNTAGGSIEVLEFFGYWCPHCRAFEPLFETWWKTVPMDVNVVRIPVVWDDTPRTWSHASLYYTLETLGRLDLHSAVFDAVDASKKARQGALESFEDQQAFAAKNGIDAQSFARIYHSEAVREKVERAARITRAYRVIATPMMAVYGTYRCDPAQLQGGFVDLLKLVDSLTQRVRAERQRNASRC